PRFSALSLRPAVLSETIDAVFIPIYKERTDTMMLPSTSVSPQGSRRKRRRTRRPSSQAGNGATATPNRPAARITLDVVVVRGCELLHVRARASLIARIDPLTRRTDRTRPHDRGPWVLVLTSTNLEGELGRQLSRALAKRCQG